MLCLCHEGLEKRNLWSGNVLLNIVSIYNFLNGKHTNSTGTKSKYKQMELRKNKTKVSVHERKQSADHSDIHRMGENLYQ